MPQIPAKEVKKQVACCACPDHMKGSLEASLLTLPGLNIGNIAKFLQTVEQFAIKYGPQIWADVQVLISLFGGMTPTPGPTPAHDDGPAPAQVATFGSPGRLTTRSGFVRLFVCILLAVLGVLLFSAGLGLAAERLPQCQLALAQNAMPADCPCGPDCQCGPDCRCGQEKTTAFTFVSRSREIADDQLVYYAPIEEQQDVLAQTPKKLPQNAAAPQAVAGPTFHTETRTRCGRFGCVPYTVLVQDYTPPAGFTAAPSTAYQSAAVPIQCWSVPVTSYQTVQVPTTTYQTFGSADGGSCSQASEEASATAHVGFFQRFRQWRAARHAARVGGCFSCGG